jgi:hypothetical protein
MHVALPRYEGFQSTPFPYCARLLDWDSTPIIKADLSAISYTSYDLDAGKAIAATGSLTIASVIFDSYQTDARWGSMDPTGYNFAAAIPAACFPTADHVYLVKIVFTPVSGDAIPVAFEVIARSLP